MTEKSNYMFLGTLCCTVLALYYLRASFTLKIHSGHKMYHICSLTVPCTSLGAYLLWGAEVEIVLRNRLTLLSVIPFWFGFWFQNN